jgi:hypothetical protein
VTKELILEAGPKRRKEIDDERADVKSRSKNKRRKEISDGRVD